MLVNQLPPQELIVCIINSVDRIIILSNRSLILQQYVPIPCRPTRFTLSSIRKVTYHQAYIEINFTENNSI